MDSINLSQALRLYEQYKRENDTDKNLYYVTSENEFAVLKRKECENRDDAVFVMNCYTACSENIDLYLEQPFITQYKAECEKKMKGEKSKVVACLWFFEHIDGAYDFEIFDEKQIRKRLERFCRKRWYEFFWESDDIPYNLRTWLTDERTK